MELPSESLEELQQLEELTAVLSELRDNLPKALSTSGKTDADDPCLLDQVNELQTIGGIQQILRELISVESNDLGRRSFGDVLFEVPWDESSRKDEKSLRSRHLQAMTVSQLMAQFED